MFMFLSTLGVAEYEHCVSDYPGDTSKKRSM